MSSFEIGGYLELECGRSPLYHARAIMLNSARNALRYILRANNIKKINTPYYTCPVVWQILNEEGCDFKLYNINEELMPKVSFESREFILYNNYFGVCAKNVEILLKKYPHLIVDNAQSFFSKPGGFASFYSPRKFFGLPDGGLAFSKKKIKVDFDLDESYGRCMHLLKRWDIGATKGYEDFKKNDEYLIGKPIMTMSRLTRALMGNIDYQKSIETRRKNFSFLHKSLKNINELKFDILEIEVPMVYPFLIKKTGLRDNLINNEIYIASYWSGIEAYNNNTYEKYLRDHLLPLPIDQRYDIKDMKKILKVIMSIL